MNRDSSDPRRGRGPGPTVLVLPLLVLVVAILWMRHGRREVGGERPRTPERGETTPLAGWVGEARLEDVPLEVRLVPLHAESERQDFDRDALAGRLEDALGRPLPGGEPWRLILGHHGPEDAPSVDLAGVRVRDASGGELRPAVPAAPAPGAGEPADPLVSLLAAPRVLPPEHEVTLVLWGPRPGAEPELLLGERRIRLRPDSVDRGTVPSTLARLDRGAPR